MVTLPRVTLRMSNKTKNPQICIGIIKLKGCLLVRGRVGVHRANGKRGVKRHSSYGQKKLTLYFSHCVKLRTIFQIRVIEQRNELPEANGKS